MTTDRQIAANRQNAQHSTGPRTPQGKANSSRNNTRHGLKATTPVIPKLESPEEWEHHRALTISGLNPVNALETALAERVALILWRLDRVARYERDVTSQGQEHAVVDLANGAAGDDAAPTDAAAADRDLTAVRKRYNEARRRARVLALLAQGPTDAHVTGPDANAALNAIGEQVPRVDITIFLAPEIVPDHLYYENIPDWTVERLLRFIVAFAAANNRDPDELLNRALDRTQLQRNAAQITCRRLERQVQGLRQQRILPQPRKLDHLVKYETHLMRQLSQTLGHLQRLQHQREAASRRMPYNDYHQPIDYPAPLPIPASPAADPFPPALTTLPQHPEPSPQHLRSEHSNPIYSETGPDPAPICTTPAPRTEPPTPTPAPIQTTARWTTIGGEGDHPQEL